MVLFASSAINGMQTMAKLPIWKKALFGLLPLTLVFLVAEGIARQLPAARPAKIEPYIAQWQAHWDGDFWVAKPGPEINREGFRDRDHDLTGRPGTWRIACLGDSVTMGPGVFRDKTWSAFLESYLRTRHPAVEVFNVAMGGWCVRQERTAYERFVRKYSVDDVILGICLNDLPELQNNVAFSRVSRPLLWLHRRSALVKRVVNANAREISSVMELFTRDDSANVNNAWKLFSEEILEFRDELEEDGVRLSIVLFPFRFQVLPDAPEPIAQARMAELCRKNGIPFFDVLETLRQVGPGAFYDYDHLTATGSEEAARYIFQTDLLRRPTE